MKQAPGKQSGVEAVTHTGKVKVHFTDYYCGFQTKNQTGDVFFFFWTDVDAPAFNLIE